MNPQGSAPFSPDQPNDNERTDPPAESNLPSPQVSGMTADTPIVQSEPDREPPTTPDAAQVFSAQPNPTDNTSLPGVAPADATQPLAAPIMQPAKKSKKPLLIVGLVVGILVILLGSAYAVFALWYNNPKKVAVDAAYGLMTSKTMISDGALTFTMKTNNGDIKADVTFSSKLNKPDVAGQGNATFKLSGPHDINFEMSGAGMLTNSGVFYFKFDQLGKALEQYYKDDGFKALLGVSPNLKASLDAFVKKIDGVWIKIDEDYVKQFAKDFNYNETKQCYQKAYDEFMGSDAQQKQLMDAYQQHEFLQLTSQGTENRDGAWVNKYAVTTDLSKAYDAVIAYEKTDFAKKALECGKDLSNSESRETKKPSDDDIRKQQQELDKVKVTLYVSTIGHELKRAEVNYSDNDSKTSVNSHVNLTQNQPVDVADPEKSIPLKEFQSDVERLQQEMLEALMAVLIQQNQQEQALGPQMAS